MQERTGDENPCKDEEDTVEKCQYDSQSGCPVSFFLIAGTEID